MDNSAPTQFPILDKGKISFGQLDEDTRSRFIRNEVIVYTILVVVAMTLVGTLVGVGAIVTDQLHFNNELYRDGAYNHTKTVITSENVTNTTQTVTFPNLKPTN